MPASKVRPAVILMVSSALALTLAACGGGGGDETPAPTPTPSPLPSPPTVPPLASGKVVLQSQPVGTINKWPSGDSTTGGTGQTIDGMACAAPIETYHVHSHLSIFLNGDQLIVPDHIGLPKKSDGTECTYPVHTHDASGEIHVEAAAAGTFTLGNFYHFWGQPLDRTNVGGITGLPITVYIVDQGQTAATEYTGDLANIELPSHRQITIVIGTAITTIPNYDFNGA